MIDDLLDLADHLARLEPGRPKDSSLRRSVSTAYYALFHALAYNCSDELVGWRKPWEVFKPIYRSLDHGSAKKYFERSAGRHQNPSIAQIGTAFIALQEARHRADYDPQPSFGRKEALDYCAQARFAVATIRTLPSDAKLALAVDLISRIR